MYTTQQKVSDYLQIDNSAINVSTWINWVSKYIDDYCNTTFESANATKYYDTRGQSRLFVDDLTSVTSVQLLDENGDVDETLTENSDFWLYPLNKTTKNEIRLDPYGSHPNFLYGSKRLKITGLFGVDTAVPADIEMVATQMIADIVKQTSGEARGVTSESLGDRSISYSDVSKYLTPYMSVLDLYRTPVL